MSPVPAVNGQDAHPTFDVVIVDVPAPSTSQINRFYTAEFFAEVKRVLAKDGVLSFSLGQYENYVSKELARMLASANATLKLSFRNVLVIPGGRVFFVASDGKLSPNIAARLEQRRIPTQFVNRHYLDAMLTSTGWRTCNARYRSRPQRTPISTPYYIITIWRTG